MASAQEAVDPFGFIDGECGHISPSLEERLFRLSPFINDNPPLAPLSPLPPADAPILICSLPDEQSPTPPPPPPPPQKPNNNKGESSSKETAATTSTKTKKNEKKKDGKRRRRLMGAQLRTSSSSDTDDTQPPAEPEMAPPLPSAAPTTTRKLPESILKQNADRRDVSKEEATDVAPTESDLVVTLEDVVRKYSRQPDTTYDHMSLLEIAEMKGFFHRTS